MELDDGEKTERWNVAGFSPQLKNTPMSVRSFVHSPCGPDSRRNHFHLQTFWEHRKREGEVNVCAVRASKVQFTRVTFSFFACFLKSGVSCCISVYWVLYNVSVCVCLYFNSHQLFRCHRWDLNNEIRCDKSLSSNTQRDYA